MSYEQHVVARVGAETYTAACARAWAGDDAGDVPHELADLWFDPALTPDERLEHALRLYREMPGYANTMYLRGEADGFDPGQRARLWTFVREMLDRPEPQLADPIAYALWVDWFEDASTAAEAWREVTTGAGRRRLERVLAVAGPALWPDKEALFTRLIDDPAWHPHIYAALHGTAVDVYGRGDPSAVTWLDRLDLSPDPPDRAEIRAALKRRRWARG